MKALLLALWLGCVGAAQPLSFSQADAQAAGLRVWQNECSGTVDGLTSWNQGEDFASLGIGHFIWYPAGQRGPFEESFPKLLQYFRDRQVEVPGWLSGPCPWSSRQSFLDDFEGPRLSQLRGLLADQVAEQTRFMALRLEAALPQMVNACPRQSEPIRRRFERILKSPGGLYVLLDYVNFKGEGLQSGETYHGQGWGLLQVLQEIDDSQSDPLAAFAEAAEAVITRRVENSPPERGEQRWLPGWLKRIRGYAE